MAFADVLRQEVFNPGAAADLLDSIVGQLATKTWTPTSYSASGSMTWTSVSAVHAYYAEIGSDLVFITGRFTGTTGGTANTVLYVNGLPTANVASPSFGLCGGQIINGIGYGGIVYITADGVVGIKKWDGSNWALSANTGGFVQGVYKRA